MYFDRRIDLHKAWVVKERSLHVEWAYKRSLHYGMSCKGTKIGNLYPPPDRRQCHVMYRFPLTQSLNWLVKKVRAIRWWTPDGKNGPIVYVGELGESRAVRFTSKGGYLDFPNSTRPPHER